MATSFSLSDADDLRDLSTFLGRSGRVDDGSARLVGGGGVLAVYVAILYPSGLLDESATVLGLRTFALVDAEPFDVVVPVRALLDRFAHLDGPVAARSAPGPVVVSLPPEVSTVPWAGVSPPRAGWTRVDAANSELLERVARSGIDEVAAAIPSGTGEQIVGRVRSEVWGREIDGLERVPAGAAFAAFSLGFLAADDPVNIFETGPWCRLSSGRGHVLVRRRTRSPLS